MYHHIVVIIIIIIIMTAISLFFEKSLPKHAEQLRPDIRYRQTTRNRDVVISRERFIVGAYNIVHILERCKFRGASYAGDSSPDGSGGIYYESAYI